MANAFEVTQMDHPFYHIGFLEKQEARYAILPGDPGRVEKIAAYLDDAYFLCSNREFTTYCGRLDGVPVLVTSTGIGGPSAAIAVEELYQSGVRTFLRVGTCGGMQAQVCGGDLVIANAAIRMEGTSKEYAPVEYPAVSDFTVTSALEKAARQSGQTYHIGVVQSKDSFYGQHTPERMPVSAQLQTNWDAWIRCGALASEMETAAVFTVAGILRARAGCVLYTLWNQEREKAGLPNIQGNDTGSAIRTAVQAIRIMIQQDKNL